MRKSLLFSLLLSLLCAFNVSAKKSSNIKCELILNDGKKVEGWLVKEKSSSYGPYMVKNATDVVVASSAESKDGTCFILYTTWIGFAAFGAAVGPMFGDVAA